MIGLPLLDALTTWPVVVAACLCAVMLVLSWHYRGRSVDASVQLRQRSHAEVLDELGDDVDRDVFPRRAA